jgi:hypothetical protein
LLLRMNTFIRLAEVWKPSADGQRLEHAGGCYEAAPAFGALSSRMGFGRGEGLPGTAWAAGRPQLWAPLDSSRFLRAQAATDAGLACALALPTLVDGRVSSVAVLLCAGGAGAQGAVELWHNDARVTGDLRLAEGYFSPAGSAVEAMARDGWLPRGSGAPGMAWQQGGAVFIDQLDGASGFLRAQAAAEAGLVRALALPCGAAGGAAGGAADAQTWVVSLLSSSQAPIARRVEGWLVNRATGTLRRGFGHDERSGQLPADDGPGLPLEAMGAIGTAARDGTAEVQRTTAGHAGLSAADAAAAGLGALLALPLPGEHGVGEVVALYF